MNRKCTVNRRFSHALLAAAAAIALAGSISFAEPAPPDAPAQAAPAKPS